MKYLLLVVAFLTMGCHAQNTDTAIKTKPSLTSTVPQSIWNIPDHPHDKPALIAHYLPWFETLDHEPEDPWLHWKWNHAKANHDPNRILANNKRDIASVNYPLIGPYSSDSRAVIRYHLKSMKAAGIDAVAFLWYGPHTAIDKRLPMVLDEAEKLQMRVAVCYEEKINWPPYRFPQDREEIIQTATDDLNFILKQYASHPAYLRRKNIPFVFQFNYYGADELGPRNILPDEFKQILDQINEPMIFGRKDLHNAYHPPIQSSFVWWTQGGWPKQFADQVRKKVDAGQLDFFMAMICPGFDDTGVWGWSNTPRKSEVYGIELLKTTCNDATYQNPELIQIVTWNDFNEGTVIEPTTGDGFKYLDFIETWWNKITGRPVNLLDNRNAYREYVKTCSKDERNLLPMMTSEKLNP